MPYTVSFLTKTEEREFEAATPLEVEALIAEFEAADEALNAATATADQAYGEHPQYNSEHYLARQAAIQPFEARKAAANSALSASRSLPVGTFVRFATSAGWNGSETDFGTIAKVTESSYVVEKESRYESKTARLDREKAHGYQSSYGGNSGGRSLSVVRTPAQQAAYAVEESARRVQQQRQNDERRAYNEAVYAAERAQEKQAYLLNKARAHAVDTLVKRHQAEFDGMLNLALDLLSTDVPGRDESTLPAEPSL